MTIFIIRVFRNKHTATDVLVKGAMDRAHAVDQAIKAVRESKNQHLMATVVKESTPKVGTVLTSELVVSIGRTITV